MTNDNWQLLIDTDILFPVIKSHLDTSTKKFKEQIAEQVCSVSRNSKALEEITPPCYFAYPTLINTSNNNNNN